MPDPISLPLVMAATTVAAALASLRGGPDASSLGPLPAFEDPEQELGYEIFWWDEATRRTVFEGKTGTVSFAATPDRLLPSLSRSWIPRDVDRSSLSQGDGTDTVWIRSGAIAKETPTRVWAFHGGTPMRTTMIRTTTGRVLHGILPEVDP